MIKNLIPTAFLILASSFLTAQAPDFTITNSNGQTQQLYADFVHQGKVVVLEIFFTTCPPCATHAPHLQTLYETVKTQFPGKVEFILLSDKSADNNAAVAQYKTSKGLTMVAAGSDGGSLAAVQPYKAGQFGPFYGTPTFVIIAPNTGALTYDVRGGGAAATMDSIHQKIMALLASPTLPECHIQTPQGDTLKNYRLRLEVPGGSPVFHDETDGVFTLSDFPGIPGFPYFEISASKNDQVLNGVSTYDLVQINKQILGITLFQEPWQFVAADANNSGTVSTLDIVELRKLILGVYDTLPNSPSWVFSPAKDTIGPVACPEFLAIKKGDVTGNASADSLVQNNDRSAWPLLLADRQLVPGKTFSIPIQVGQSGAWTGLQGAFYFDPAALEILGLQSGHLTGWDENAWFVKDGRLSWSWFSAEPVAVSPAEPVLLLECRALRSGRISEILHAETTPLRAEVYDASAERFPLEWQYHAGAAQSLLLLPNPARERFSLVLESEISEQINVQLIDFQGRVVLEQNWDLQTGTNVLELRPATLPAGLYAVRAGALATGKLLWRL